MTRLPSWVRAPSAWIEGGGLKSFRWGAGTGAVSVGALITWIVLAQHSDRETGHAKVTYDALCRATGLSRKLQSESLKRLVAVGLITRRPDLGQSVYALIDYDPLAGWAMLPAKRFYADGRIPIFADFNLRKVAELDALKLYLLFVTRRDRNDNYAHITYPQIRDYSGIEPGRIRTALSLLTTHGLIHVEQRKSLESDFGIANAYRIVGLDSYRHAGTSGRAVENAFVDALGV